MNDVNATVPGEQIKAKRFDIAKRAAEILFHQNPDIDWNDNNLVLTVVPKEKE